MVHFKQSGLNEAFLRDGYVSFPLLNQEQVQRLRDFYLANKQRHLTHQPILHSTSDTADYDLVQSVDTFIQTEIKDAVDAVMDNYEPLIANYLTKEPGDDSETEFHQDPTLVEEPPYVSGNIWIALQDTDSTNGNLRIIKGSHRLTNNIRATPNCPLFFQEFKDILPRYSTEVPLKAGEAIFVSHSTVHGATSNKTGKERIAAVMAIKSKPAPWIFYYWEPGAPIEKVEKYSISPEAFSRLVKNERPLYGTLIGYVRPDFKMLTKQAFLAFMEENYGKKTLLSRVRSLFSRSHA